MLKSFILVFKHYTNKYQELTLPGKQKEIWGFQRNQEMPKDYEKIKKFT